MGRPKVVLNCATSHNGKLAAADGSPVRFSDEEDWARVHRLRASCDAILVGVGTILADDPHLTLKPEYAEGEHPVRVILDAWGRTPEDARAVDDAAPTLVVTGKGAQPIPGVQQVRVKDKNGLLDLGQVLDALGAIGVQTVLVEGGEQILKAFLAHGWDTFTLFQSKELLDGEGPALWDLGGPESMGLTVQSKVEFSAGTLWTFSPE